ncbi:MAG: aminotransferase class IV [Deltaproteobacteria bacterium]|nr:aminotransferase class IV [Deltaproteobacteria bacterium]
MTEQILFFNGKWYPASARPDFLDFEFFAYCHALHYASAVFEGSRCYPNLAKNDGTINLIGIDIRIDRLFGSMEYAWMRLSENPQQVWNDFVSLYPPLAEKYKAVLKGKIKKEDVIQFRYSKADVKDFIIKTVLLNLHNEFFKPSEGCYVRPLVMRGNTPGRSLGVFSLGHSVDFLLSVKPWGKYLGKEIFEKGAPVLISQHGNEEWNRQFKLASNYLTGQRIVNFACYNQFSECLLTDATPERNVLEGSGENLVFYKGNNKFVSPEQKGKPILPGTTLKVVDQMIRAMGGEIEYRDIPVQEILDKNFQGAVMTGTAAEITPISLVFDTKTKKAIEIPMPQEIKDLQKTYLNLVGGLEVDARLKNLQQSLIQELKWIPSEHNPLLNLIEK